MLMSEQTGYTLTIFSRSRPISSVDFPPWSTAHSPQKVSNLRATQPSPPCISTARISHYTQERLRDRQMLRRCGYVGMGN